MAAACEKEQTVETATRTPLPPVVKVPNESILGTWSTKVYRDLEYAGSDTLYDSTLYAPFDTVYVREVIDTMMFESDKVYVKYALHDDFDDPVSYHFNRDTTLFVIDFNTGADTFLLDKITKVALTFYQKHPVGGFSNRISSQRYICKKEN